MSGSIRLYRSVASRRPPIENPRFGRALGLALSRYFHDIPTSVRKTASLVAARCGMVYFIGGAPQRSRSGNRVEEVWDSGKVRETQIVYL